MKTAAKHFAKTESGDAGPDLAPLSATKRVRQSIVQPKVRIGTSDDHLEHEADRVAEAVVRGEKVTGLGTSSPTPVQRETAREEHDREEDGGEVRRAARGPSNERSVVASHAIASKGTGTPLLASTRERIEASTDADLGDVRVHEDGHARRAADAINARAFTHGRDIWLGSGESQTDVRLMAHEAAHVVQQGASGEGGVVQRQEQGDSAATADAEEEIDPTKLDPSVGQMNDARDTITFEDIAIPGFKLVGHRRLLYTLHRPLKRTAGYDRKASRTGHVAKWKRRVDKSRIRAALEAKLRQNQREVGSRTRYVFEVPVADGGAQSSGSPFLVGTLNRVARALTIPSWGKGASAPQPMTYTVDHIVELQLAGWTGSQDAWSNDLDNMELLEESTNKSSGPQVKEAIEDRVKGFIKKAGSSYGNLTEIKERYHLAFKRAVPGKGLSSLQEDLYWDRGDIQSARHVDPVVVRDFDAIGGAGTVLLFPSDVGGVPRKFSWPGEVTEDERHWLAPFEIVAKDFDVEGKDEKNLGSLTIRVPPGDPTWQPLPAEAPITIKRFEGAGYAGRASKQGIKAQIGKLRKVGLSPIRIDTFDILSDAGIVVEGAILPELPLLRGGIDFALREGAFSLEKTFTGEDLEVPSPFSIRSTSLVLSADTTKGLEATGDIEFGIDRVGQGSLEASVSSGGPVSFAGSFDFESSVFEPARVEVSYVDGALSGRGTITIPEGKVPGVRSASLDVAVDRDSISGTGKIEPTLRAIQQGTLTFSHSVDEGMRLAGELQLSDSIPNVKSGTIGVEISKAPDAEGYSLSAHGEVQAGLPGLTANLTADYRDGLFDVRGEGSYQRGLLSGSVRLGATNRAVADDGTIGKEPGAGLTAYGEGTVTAQLTPWLQGTVGLRLLRNGEIEIAGKIALPDVVEVFPERKHERNVFSINLDIPIVGVAAAGQRVGIFATVGGGLDLSAGAGPGRLEEVQLEVTYNPDHEDQTHIEGGARFVVPAHAGLRLFVRGGIGAGIPLVSASAGLEISGQLGIEGALGASATIDWMPTKGLTLDAEGKIEAEPKFEFAVSGFVLVEAGVSFASFDLYDQRWDLAGFELGSGLKLGMRLPIHYQEGEPFEHDWSKVEFDVPDIDPLETLSGLMDRIA
ncbi:MAG: DUF4157 domain-containing protein [Deltaproteobacteria bacterium]